MVLVRALGESGLHMCSVLLAPRRYFGHRHTCSMILYTPALVYSVFTSGPSRCDGGASAGRIARAREREHARARVEARGRGAAASRGHP